MAPVLDSLSPEGSTPAAEQPAGYPFGGAGVLARATPFAVVAAMAEASLALPPGPTSTWPVIASLALLLAVSGAFLLPWAQLPAWMAVLVPLAYTGSVLALVLAAGPTSGIGIVILIPLIWTALFHRPWESACIVAAIVAVEVIISVTPVVVPDSVMARRVLLWVSLGALISVATHGLRDRVRRSQEQTAKLEAHLREVTVLADRERIAADLRDKVIQRIFATGLSLQGAANLATEPEVRRRLAASVDDLDQVVQLLRDAIFKFERRPQGRGLRAEILDVCSELSPVPEITFSGPVDGALHPTMSVQLLAIFREALAMTAQHATPASIGIVADKNADLAAIEAHMTYAVELDRTDQAFTDLRDRATQAGLRVDMNPEPGLTRFVLLVPMSGGQPMLSAQQHAGPVA